MSHPCSLLQDVLLVLDWVGQGFSIHVHAKHKQCPYYCRYYHEKQPLIHLLIQHKKTTLGELKKTAAMLL
jgi:hypothetical protein